jgi:transposase
MHENEVFGRLLGISKPWRVKQVDLQLAAGEVHVHLEHDPGIEWPCAQCGRPCKLYDHQPERSWRHLDVFQYQAFLHARPPRSECLEHGILAVRLPWAESGSRFTVLFEGLAIVWLQAASQSAVAQRLRLTWDEIHGIMERAVKRGMARRKAEPLPYLGVDETAARRGHNYLTIVNDPQRSRVLYVAEERTTASLDGFWPTLSSKQRASILAVTVDMWDPFVNSIRKHVPHAEIVFDKFHIAKHLGEAVDLVRRREHRLLRARGDERLKGTKYDWLSGRDRFSLADWRAFGELRRSDLKTARAWALRQNAMRLFNFRYAGAARRFFRHWYFWATHSRLEPVIKVARTLKARFQNIITYLRHPITNAISESLNARIQWLKYTARGYRNTRNFMTAIYFHCGGLDLKPSPT